MGPNKKPVLQQEHGLFREEVTKGLVKRLHVVFGRSSPVANAIAESVFG